MMSIQKISSRRHSRPRSVASIALISIALGLLAGSAGAARHDRDYWQLLAQELRGRDLDPAVVTLPHRLTEEMRRWAHRVAPAKLSRQQKLDRLIEGLFDAEHLELEYAWGYTGTAAEVFERREANCLAFTNLFVAMAREVGVPVHFLAVKDATSYRKADDLVVISDHIAVGYGTPRQVTVYDFSSEPGDKTFERLRRISDLTAIAMFHSNRGAEELQQGRVEESIGWLETAVALDPELVNAWVNLGVGRRRTGDNEGAEAAYKRALELDPRVYSAYQNLASILYFEGRGEEAREYEQALRRAPNKNPYTFLNLGDISFRSGRLAEARRFYRRAVSLGRDAESYAALGELAAQTGDRRTARKMLRKAQKLDLDNQRTVRLAAAMGADRG